MIEKFKNFWGKSIWTKIIVVLVVFFLIGAIASTGSSDSSNEEAKTEQKKEVKKDTKKYIGDKVKSGDVEITAKKPKISKTFGIKGAEDKAKGQFVTFEITAKNVGKEGTSISDTDFNLFVKGAKHKPAMVTNDDNQVKPLVFEELSPKTSVTSTLTFDVADTKQLKGSYLEFKLSDNWEAEAVKIYIK